MNFLEEKRGICFGDESIKWVINTLLNSIYKEDATWGQTIQWVDYWIISTTQFQNAVFKYKIPFNISYFS